MAVRKRLKSQPLLSRAAFDGTDIIVSVRISNYSCLERVCARKKGLNLIRRFNSQKGALRGLGGAEEGRHSRISEGNTLPFVSTRPAPPMIKREEARGEGNQFFVY